jgi:predicted transposase/invertase (TIGR01784 family)
MNTMNQPHDKFFKRSMADIEIARDFVQNYVPAGILKGIDLNTLKLEKDSYTDPKLSQYFSDILFSVSYESKKAYLYLLFEHKSYLYYPVALQLLKNMVMIWEKVVRKNVSGKLPVILPLVVYHGKELWNIPLRFHQLFEEVKGFTKEQLPFIPDFQYMLYDFSPDSEEQIKGSVYLKIFLDILHIAFEEDKEKILETLSRAERALQTLENQEKASEYFETYIRYIFHIQKGLKVEEVYQTIKTISIERGDKMLTIAEELRKEGKKEGKKEGIKEGKSAAITETAKKMLEEGVSIPSIKKYTGLTEEEIKQIKKEMTR